MKHFLLSVLTVILLSGCDDLQTINGSFQDLVVIGKETVAYKGATTYKVKFANSKGDRIITVQVSEEEFRKYEIGKVERMLLGIEIRSSDPGPIIL